MTEQTGAEQYTWTIRRAQPDDLDLLARHRDRMWRDMGTTDEGLLQRVDQGSRDYLAWALPAGEYRAWVVEADGKVAGSGAVLIQTAVPSVRNESGRLGYILSLYTEPEFRHMGVASRIMTTILDTLRAEGITTASLHASQFGRPLYEKLGFNTSPEMRMKLI